MSDFFNNVREIQKNINKYVHKQGYASFYQVVNDPFISKRKNVSEKLLLNDFEIYLKVCIGAVAVYRLCIDALPIVLMDEEYLYRSGDFIVMPFSEKFVDKYICKRTD